MYHKVGPRPAGTQKKALYVSPALFSRQIGELRKAGFNSATMDEACVTENREAPRIVITFDDGFANVLDHALKPLAENNFHAIQFLVPGLLGGRNEWDLPAGEVPEKIMDASQVREWMAAGHEIGAHTMTHPDLATLSLEDAREEISASKKSLEDTFGVPVEHFCYPYGSWNGQIRDLVAGAGFRTACTTKPDVNTSATNPFEISRWMARHASPRPKEVLARLVDRMFN